MYLNLKVKKFKLMSMFHSSKMFIIGTNKRHQQQQDRVRKVDNKLIIDNAKQEDELIANTTVWLETLVNKILPGFSILYLYETMPK
jgi:hypothetical protein